MASDWARVYAGCAKVGQRILEKASQETRTDKYLYEGSVACLRQALAHVEWQDFDPERRREFSPEDLSTDELERKYTSDLSAFKAPSFVPDVNELPHSDAMQTAYRSGRSPLTEKDTLEAPGPTSSSAAPETRVGELSARSGEEAELPGSFEPVSAGLGMSVVDETVSGVPSGEMRLSESKRQREETGETAVSLKETGSVRWEEGGLPQRQRREVAVPASPLSRMANFGGLFVGLMGGTVAESWRQLSGRSDSGGGQFSLQSAVLSDANSERIGQALCKLRGAALKLGQFLSMQDEMLPPALRSALERARASADVMPRYQLEKVLKTELGEDWGGRFAEFEEQPFAAASIGQVHRASLFDGRRVAVKVQYPGVDKSIDSDLNNLMTLVKYTNLLPKNLFLDVLAREIRSELVAECDYENEARFYKLFKHLFKDEKGIHVPDVVSELSTRRVLVTEYVDAITLREAAALSQSIRDSIGIRLLRLCLKELFVFKQMQTDPNPGNFFYQPKGDTLYLIDFGAGRSYKDTFVDDYLRVVHAASLRDWDRVYFYSTRLGFIDGTEHPDMLAAHCESVMAVGEPFRTDSEGGIFDFGRSGVKERMVELGPVMVKYRKRPPPPEIYSLHRKLAGCYLLCITLRARFASSRMFSDVFREYTFQEPDPFEAAGRPSPPLDIPARLRLMEMRKETSGEGAKANVVEGKIV
uniref:ABC1 atypical kinase-like domain-containing protein n=1 Tax=Chromera velia CCMP2878 TaxID=1169474 RepID=A0A0G4FTW3_9ALVE|eukprot:Cvel_18753.t1-p1 / transcript=Cvel_18753.t1 / gene=Cvel_18753 / organism=Chromera_velia_CCMP2878 / gene_product=Chaperone activity of bc1 complex-like,, putative / transcript_product=Chaperone activity of bc1 complex-like,, putative / location=Cvel_scaffold1572:37861-40794(+) / protein_length=699 / sequence_SO=supercontig / SO=protein_coding / is_pseudo=false